jgi:hypothetical protein
LQKYLSTILKVSKVIFVPVKKDRCAIDATDPLSPVYPDNYREGNLGGYSSIHSG